ncbi:MAG: hypothetical protein V7754_20720 [Halioglobus sp.]
MRRKVTDWGGNIAAFLLVIICNVLSNAVPLNNQTMPVISAKYPSLFTPAGFTFSIWGLIYLSLTAFVIYQALPAQRNNKSLGNMGIFFKVNCLANSLWIFAWHYDFLFLSMLLMVVILLSLILIYRSLNIVDAAEHSVHQWLVQMPFGLYTGWVTVASIANASALQVAMQWDDLLFSAITWTLIKLALAGAITVTVILRRGDMVFGLVVAWASFGISAKQVATPEVAGATWMLTILALLLVAMEGLRRYSARNIVRGR